MIDFGMRIGIRDKDLKSQKRLKMLKLIKTVKIFFNFITSII